MKLAILDRDGVINFDSEHYIKSPAEWRPIPGSIEAIARLNQNGFRIAVATNQSGIGRGYMTEQQYREVEAEVSRQILHRDTQLEIFA